QGSHRGVAPGARDGSEQRQRPPQHRPGREAAAWTRAAHEEVTGHHNDYQEDLPVNMNRHVRTAATLLPILSLTLLLAGCPKRPAMTAATAPPPVPPAAAAPAPAPAPPKEYRSNAALQQIFFAFDKSDIRPADAQTLAASAAYLKANPNQLVLIEGHCDERGTSEYNLALGERRAKAAANFLV